MTVVEAADAGGRLVDLLTQQRGLYMQLRELAMKQTSLVDGNDPETLLKVLASRQRIIDKLTAIDREFRPIRANWREVSSALDGPRRHQVQTLIDQVQEILSEILTRDASDSQKLSNSQQQVARQIKGASAGKKMNQVYAGQATGKSSRFFDAGG